MNTSKIYLKDGSIDLLLFSLPGLAKMVSGFVFFLSSIMAIFTFSLVSLLLINAESKAGNVGADACLFLDAVMRLCGSSFLIVSIFSVGHQIVI